MINEAAINAVKNGRQLVNQSDLFEAFELVAVGGKEKKDRVMSDKERKIVSYHEVGHALVSACRKIQSLCRKSQSYHVPWAHSDIHSRHLKRRNTLRQRMNFSPKSQHIWQVVQQRCWYLTQSQAEPQMI